MYFISGKFLFFMKKRICVDTRDFKLRNRIIRFDPLPLNKNEIKVNRNEAMIIYYFMD